MEQQQQQQQQRKDSILTKETSFKGFGASPPANAASGLTVVDEAKSELIDLLSSMTGKANEFRRAETLVNTLESLHQPFQTLDFLNLLQQGEWQLLFSTNLASPSRAAASPKVFRMREMVQTVACGRLAGNLTTAVVWDLADSMPGIFDCTGTFSVQSTYEIQQGSRLALRLRGHVLKNRGKTFPSDAQALVGLLFRAIPKQLVDPTDHSSDTTYLDGNLKILRYTGPKFEAVRDIWIRKDSIVVQQQQPETPSSANAAAAAAAAATCDTSMLDDEDTSMFMMDDQDEEEEDEGK